MKNRDSGANRMNVLVTGGAGYIGSVMVEQLIAHGHHAVVHDNLSEGHRVAVAPEAAFVEGDLHDRQKLARVMGEHRASPLLPVMQIAFDEGGFRGHRDAMPLRKVVVNNGVMP